MTFERPSQSKAMFWIIGAAAGVVVLLLWFSARSFVMLLGAPQQQAGAVGPAPAAEKARRDAGVDVSVKHEEHGVINHGHEAAPSPAPSPAPASPGRAPQKNSEFTVDYQTLREREVERKQMTENLRAIAKDNPESGYAMTEEQLHKFEQSGGSFR